MLVLVYKKNVYLPLFYFLQQACKRLFKAMLSLRCSSIVRGLSSPFWRKICTVFSTTSPRFSKICAFGECAKVDGFDVVQSAVCPVEYGGVCEGILAETGGWATVVCGVVTFDSTTCPPVCVNVALGFAVAI